MPTYNLLPQKKKATNPSSSRVGKAPTNKNNKRKGERKKNVPDERNTKKWRRGADSDRLHRRPDHRDPGTLLLGTESGTRSLVRLVHPNPIKNKYK